jgi:Leucine-rich repeat (LRR) protein
MHTLTELRAGQLTGIKRLDLGCGLTEFPKEIFDLAESLEVLNLSGNRLQALPTDLARLKKLRILFCSHNIFTTLPEVVGECESLEMVGFRANAIEAVPAASLPKRLRWLILTENRIQQLPAELGYCQQMQKLMLSGNHLAKLPESLAGCGNLELLRVACSAPLKVGQEPVLIRRLVDGVGCIG